MKTTKQEYIHFKKILEYFVAHLMWVVTKDESVIGYDKYIKPLVKNKTFIKTGQGYKGHKIQNLINDWCIFQDAKICINVQSNFGDYKTTKSYLNWKDTGINIIADWEEDNIKCLYQQDYQYWLKPTKRINLKSKKSISSLGLFTKENEITKDLIAFFDNYLHVFKNFNKSESSKNKKIMSSNKIPINQILYGPPGTGKTYSTVDKVVEICSPENYFHDNHLKNKETYDQLIEDGNVFFTTFHQSLGYEDFIEGIKPVAPKKETDTIIYEVEDGIFKSICEQCLDEIREIKAQKDESIQEGMSFKEKYDEFVKRIQKGLIIVKTRNGLQAKVSRVSASGNMRLKTGNDTNDYIISVGRLKKLVEELPKPKSITNIHKKVKSIIGGSHTSLYYAALESFVEFEKVLQKEIKEEGKEVKLKDVSLSKQEIEDLPKYALIIDEINRGNVSAIFGELITLLEEDKRFGHQNQIFAKLPYSKSNFIVPPNLYIIGTMNTADRSVEALDTALRRRFSFKEIMPNPSLLAGVEINDIKLDELLTTVNDRIEVLIDRDHTIGHSYFMNVKSKNELKQVFKDKILPLLQEYFFGDYSKMELVIGSYFFESDLKEVTFAVQNDNYFEKGKRYVLKDLDDDRFDIIRALQELMGNKVEE